MYRGISLVLFVVVLSLTGFSYANAVHKGRVLNAGEKKITIIDQDDEVETFVVAKDAKITRNGKSATLDEIVNGDSAKITTEKIDSIETALAIEAKAKE